MASRYGLVGLFCALLNVGIVWAGTEVLGLAYPLAAALTCPITIPLSYWLHRRVSFDVRRPASLLEFWRFLLAQLSQFVLGVAAMALVIETLHWRPWIAMATVSFLMMAYGFTASSAWVFRVWRRAVPGATTASRPAETLRVLQVSAFFPAHGGGIEVVAGQLARRLALSGVHLTWMAGGAPSERPSDEQFVGVSIDQARSLDVLERRVGLPAPVWTAGALRRLWRHVGACDVVHLHDYLYAPTLAALLFAWMRRRPVVLTQHVGAIAYESRVLRFLLQVLNGVVGRIALGAAAQVVFVGRPVQAYFERFVRFRRPSMLIANGVDAGLYWPAPTPAPSPRSAGEDRELRALFVGRFVEKKGLALLRACMDVRGIRWTFVGRGPMSPSHWQVPGEILTLRGVLAPRDVADAMRAADLLVLPSHGEGFPLVVQEALACGTPVLVSQEVADAFPRADPRCVWTVDVAGEGASERLRATLVRLAGDTHAIRSGRPMAVAVAGQWSWERCVASYLSIYDAVKRR
jgi:glycosyltransferase involved in cell wall biosynthesis/putative flippase GtrA